MNPRHLSDTNPPPRFAAPSARYPANYGSAIVNYPQHGAMTTSERMAVEGHTIKDLEARVLTLREEHVVDQSTLEMLQKKMIKKGHNHRQIELDIRAITKKLEENKKEQRALNKRLGDLERLSYGTSRRRLRESFGIDQPATNSTLSLAKTVQTAKQSAETQRAINQERYARR